MIQYVSLIFTKSICNLPLRTIHIPCFSVMSYSGLLYEENIKSMSSEYFAYFLLIFPDLNFISLQISQAKGFQWIYSTIKIFYKVTRTFTGPTYISTLNSAASCKAMATACTSIRRGKTYIGDSGA